MASDPEALLYDDLAGNRVGLRDVAAMGLAAKGLASGYRDRLPLLRRLLDHGSPAHRLDTCEVLASWGVRDGLLTVAEWAHDPDSVPWAGAPVSWNRFGYGDDAFARLADALCTAGEVPLSEPCAMLRGLATRALLVVHDRVFLDRSMALLLGTDPALAATSHREIDWAIGRGLAAARAPDRRFDVTTQVALLLDALAGLDDAAAAAAAEVLMEEHPGHDRALCEVALSMAAGSGPATLAVLRRLEGWPSASVRAEAEVRIAARERG